MFACPAPRACSHAPAAVPHRDGPGAITGAGIRRAVPPERIVRLVRSVLLDSPVARALGVTPDVLHVDHVELLLPFRDANVTVGRIVHGGAIATLIDIAGAAAAASGADPDTLRGGATGSLTVHYLAPAEGAALRAVAEVVRRGKRQVVTEVSVYAEADDGGTLVARALMSSSLF